MNLNPTLAPKRPELTFLTVRSARSPAPSAPRLSTSSLDLDGRFVSDSASRVQVPPPSQPAQLSASSNLDLDGSPDAEALSLRAPEVGVPVGHIADPLPDAPSPPPEGQGWKRPRLRMGGRVILTRDTPAVTLSRLSSGIGTLVVSAAVSASKGDSVLTCAYDLESEAAGVGAVSSLLSLAGQQRTAPPGSRRPLLVAGHDQFEKISLDLRQVSRLHRLLVMLVSKEGIPLQWAGTLVATTHDSGRVEVPLDQTPSSEVCAAVAVYQVNGELIVRAALEPAKSVRDAAQAFGYDKITWIDDHTPL